MVHKLKTRRIIAKQRKKITKKYMEEISCLSNFLAHFLQKTPPQLFQEFENELNLLTSFPAGISL